MTHSSLRAPARRSVLAAATGLAAAAASPPLPGSAPALASTPASEPPPGPDQALRRRSLRVRSDLAHATDALAVPPLPNNGDDARYPNRIGSDTRALPHDARGEVDRAAYDLALRAYETGDPADFERIPLGGTRRLLNPVGSFAVSLSGADATRFALPPTHRLDSAGRAAEAVELYWQALLRDVSFAEYRDDTAHPGILAAVEELNRLAEFDGPRANGRITPGSLFRGNALYVDTRDASGRSARSVPIHGVLDGPPVSQFLLRDAPYAAQVVPAQLRPLTARDFLTDSTEWLRVQNGEAPAGRVAYEGTARFAATGRDLATYAHFAPAAFWAAALLLGVPQAGGGGYPGLFPASVNTSNPTNPYRRSRNQVGGASTFGLPYFQSLLATGTSRTIRVAYLHKFRVHRTLRPEAYGGLVHHRVANNVAEYPVHQAVLGSRALDQSRAKFGSFLLPHAYPEGAPIHTSYSSGAAVIAAVGATLLKAFFDESLVIPDPVQPDPRDPTRLVAWTGRPLTVGGELNKLAHNYGAGRSWAGIHWRSDIAASFALGEEIAIALLRDERATFAEPFDGFRFTRFDGTQVTI
ncbi:hypothetical protein [Falsiroseomonas sp. HW251]|uniref:hypothetical protein n=1 Tax=Falsiroseomonas sp. HW251 TaxID=3390998 RepID=UPI003D321C7B